MKNRSALHFIPQFNASRLSFDNVVESVKQHINSLSENKQKKLKDELENDLANLTTKEQLDMYVSSYGDIHKQKLLIAYDHIPHKVWSEGSISVVDYGCQLLGECKNIMYEKVVQESYRHTKVPAASRGGSSTSFWNTGHPANQNLSKRNMMKWLPR